MPGSFPEVSSGEATAPRTRLKENCQTQKHEKARAESTPLGAGSEQRSAEDHRGQN